MKKSQISILNIDVLNIRMNELLDSFNTGILFTPNIDHTVQLQRDYEFYQAYKSADYIVLDSQVLFLLYKMRKKSFQEKIAGADFFPLFCEFHKNNSEIKIFLLGALDDVAAGVLDKINKKINREIIVGAYSPSHGFYKKLEESKYAIDLINKSGATTLAVAIGAPDQEKWIYRYKNMMPGIKIFFGLGATLDFIVGKQKRAPLWMQRMGLEWFYRLIHEPRRLAKRYLVHDLKFFYYYFLELLNLYKDPFAD